MKVIVGEKLGSAGKAIPGVRRGSPADLWKMSLESGNTLTAGTR